jgi:hypothetical protein
VDDAFIGAQKSQCGAIYANATGLKEIDGELQRLNIAHSLSSVWSEAEFEAADKALQEQKKQLKSTRHGELSLVMIPFRLNECTKRYSAHSRQ